MVSSMEPVLVPLSAFEAAAGAAAAAAAALGATPMQAAMAVMMALRVLPSAAREVHCKSAPECAVGMTLEQKTDEEAAVATEKVSESMEKHPADEVYDKPGPVEENPEEEVALATGVSDAGEEAVYKPGCSLELNCGLAGSVLELGGSGAGTLAEQANQVAKLGPMRPPGWGCGSQTKSLTKRLPCMVQRW